MQLGEPRSGADVPAHLTAILGSAPRSVRVRHVCAVSAEGSVMRMSPRTPRSALDFFLLNAARAGAGAILTTGRILREEPEVVHRIQGSDATRAALETWRREILGLAEPPWLAVLTSGRELDRHHPAFAAGLPVLFVTTPEGEQHLLEAGLPEKARVVSAPRMSADHAVAWLAENAPPGAIVIEAGPTAANPLYTKECRIEELWLSRYLGTDLPEDLAAAALPAALLRACSHTEHEQASGRWRFARHGAA